ncbi:TPA: hypothetical protein ACGPBH_001113 [Streptococcus suis]
MSKKLGVLLVDVPEPRFAVYHFVYLSDLLEQCETLEDLKEGLVDYFELEVLE